MSDLLLDTHTLLWFLWADSQLSQTAKDLIEEIRITGSLSAWPLAGKLQ